MKERRVYNVEGTAFGTIRGKRACTMEGCPGTRLCVLWPDGQRTWPCTKGMIVREDGHWQIWSPYLDPQLKE